MAIAVDQGYFDTHGVNVKPVFYDIYDATFADLQSGKLDGALITLGDALLIDSQAPGSVRVVLATDNSVGADAIVAPQEIRNVTDLQGKSIGANLGSFGELLILNMLEANGMTAGDVRLVNVAPETVPGSIPQVIQAGHVWEPFITESLNRGYHILYSSAETPGLIPDLLVVRAEVAENRPDDLRAFIQAWFDAQAYWQSNPSEGNAIIAEATGLPVEEISPEGIKLFGLEENRATFTQSSDVTSLYGSGLVNIEFLISTGGLTSAPNLEQLLDSSYLP